MAAARVSETVFWSSRCVYHVFLSFRGGDTRKNFADHLYTALKHAGIHTFRDDDAIERGENIDKEIENAIKESKISIIVFSKDYASSKWCLHELVMIMERRRTSEHIVLPVFYDADPSHVSQQTGSFAEAFSSHEKQFERWLVERWRADLAEVADLAGMVLRHRHEAQFIKDIVREVENKLNRKVLYVSPYVVGVDSYVTNINLWLQDQSADIKILLIFGIGGVGKTTIAKTVYNENYDKFEGSTFLESIRSETDLRGLQRQLLSDVLKGKSEEIYGEARGTMMIKDAICCRRVLIVLDDLDELKQFNAIIGNQKWLSPGSKVIITARCASLLIKDCWKLKIDELNVDDSLQLFSWHAFSQPYPIEGYVKHSESVVNYCGGIPLALEVLGSYLSGQSRGIWESALKEMKTFPNCQIQKVLRMSYDSLQNDGQRNLFLDIACFFIGMDKDRAVTILDGCGYYTKVGIQCLIDKCLVTVNEQNELMMHQLVRDMGREIIRQESQDEPGKRSRIWNHEDALSVLAKNTGTETVKGLVLDLPVLIGRNDATIAYYQANHSNWNRFSTFFRQLVNFNASTTFLSSDLSVNLESRAFSQMQHMKFLQINNAEFNGGFEYFPKSLVYLRWSGFPLKSIPNNFFLERLICLDMHNTKLTYVWNGRRFFPELKILDIGHSHGLVRTPDFSGAPNLERVIFEDCINLVEIHESIGDLQRLVLLNLKNCISLRALPKKICTWKSLGTLILSGCSVHELNMEALKNGELPTRTAATTRWLSFWHMLLPRKLPKSITFSLSILPPILVNLILKECNISDDAISGDLGSLSSLQILDLSRNPIHSLTESINGLTKLKFLSLNGCKNLQTVLVLPASLFGLDVRNCDLLQKIANLPDVHRSLYLDLQITAD